MSNCIAGLSMNRATKIPSSSTSLEPYVSIDLETTGLDTDIDQILEVGMVIDDGVTPLADAPTLHCYVSYECYSGHPKALAMNAKILEQIADVGENGRTPDGTRLIPVDHLAEYIYFFIRRHHPEGKLTAAGKNFGSFDLQFLRLLPEWQDIFRHRYIDPGMLWWDHRTDGFKLPNSDEVSRRVGGSGFTAHRALVDAYDTCRSIRTFLNK